MIPTITVLSYSDNRAGILLKNGSNPVNLYGITSVILRVDNGTVISSYDNPEVFEWKHSPLGVLYLKLGYLLFTNGVLNSDLTIFDELYTRGIYFGTFRIITKR